MACLHSAFPTPSFCGFWHSHPMRSSMREYCFVMKLQEVQVVGKLNYSVRAASHHHAALGNISTMNHSKWIWPASSGVLWDLPPPSIQLSAYEPVSNLACTWRIPTICTSVYICSSKFFSMGTIASLDNLLLAKLITSLLIIRSKHAMYCDASHILQVSTS